MSSFRIIATLKATSRVAKTANRMCMTRRNFVPAFHNVANIPNHKQSRLFSTTDSEDTVVSRCTQKITDLLKPAKLVVTSSNEDPNGSHIVVECISEEFVGKSTLQRQRLVYKAIWDELQENRVHAVDSIVAKTPAEMGM
jgi:acid stress-induced BolA-like protein IbaG/YrbA